MGRALLMVVLLAICLDSFCQRIDSNYALSTIADSLKEDANTVLQLDEAALTIFSPSKYSLKVHQVLTILNAEGAYNLFHSLAFDKFRSIENVSIKVYNASGSLFKKYSKRDYTVTSRFDGFSLATDDKLMALEIVSPGYPCTIDIQYEVNASGYVDLPDWYLNLRNATKTFRYTVITPSDLDIRYRASGFDLTPIIHSTKKMKTYSWEIKNIKAKKLPEGGYEIKNYYPRIEIAPIYFEYDGHPGKFSNWKEFGTWNYSLYQEEHPFSQERINEIKTLVAPYSSTKDKIHALYDYLKNNMRYVSIQYGIGGFRPFPVKYVDEKKYGDCKALTNYMRYLLGVAGIKSYPALINSGNKSPSLDTLFPADVFDHVILCVPNVADTIWLECTTNNLEMGFLGTFTENKNALLLTENGGVIVRTPESRSENNLLLSRNEVFLTSDGGATIRSNLLGTGEFAFIFHAIKKTNPDEQKKLLIKYLNYKLNDDYQLIVQQDSSLIPSFNLSFEMEKLYNFTSGNKFFLPQRLNMLCYEDLKNENRAIEFLFDYPYQKKDTTVIYLPKSFVVDELPEAKKLSNEFIEYKKEISAETASGKIIIITTLILKRHIIPPAQYKKLYDCFMAVNENETQNIVLKKL